MRLEHHPVDVEAARPFRIATGTTTTFQVVVCEITHEGVTGRGEAAPSERVTGETVDTVAAFLDDARDEVATVKPVDAFAFLDRLHAGAEGASAARAALDLAVHDLVGKLAGKPVHRFYGLDPGRLETSMTVSLDTPANMAAEALDHWARGFRAIKLKLGDAAEDAERVAAVRRVLPEARLRADANTGWTEEEARTLLKRLAEHHVEFVEQPLPPEADDGMVRVARESPVAVYADESVMDARDVQRLAEQGFRGGFNFKLMKTGGLRPAFHALRAARDRGYGTQLGCMLETGLGITAATHFLGLLDHADLDGNVLLARDPFDGVRPVDGWLATPTAPGLGVAPRA